MITKRMSLKIACLILACIGLGYAQQTPDRPTMLNLIPQDALFCVVINDVTAAIDNTAAYLEGIAPMPFKEPATAALNELLGKPATLPAQIVFFGLSNDPPAGGGSEMPDVSAYALVDMGDPQAALTNPLWTKPDARGLSSILNQQDPNKKTVIAKQVGNWFLLGSARKADQLLAAAQALQTTDPTQSMARIFRQRAARAGQNQPIRAYGNLARVGKLFGPMLMAQLDNAKQMISQTQGDQAPPMDVAAIMEMYKQGLQKMFDEVHYLTLAANPQSTQLNLEFSIIPVPNSDIAQMIQPADSQGALDYAGYLEKDAIFSMAGAFNKDSLRKVYDFYWQILPAMAGKTQDDPSFKDLIAMTHRWLDMMGSKFAMSFTSNPGAQPPFGMTMVMSVPDSSGYEALMTDYIKMMQGGFLNDFYKGLGLEMTVAVTPNSFTHNTVKVTEAAMTLKSTAPDSPQGQAIDQIYGGGLKFCWALAGDKYLAAMAPDNKLAIAALIDRAQTGPAGPGDFATVIASLPRQNYDGVATFNLVQAMNMVMGFMPKEVRGDQPAPKFASTSAIVIGSRAAAGRAEAGSRAVVDIVIPKQHLQELMQAIGMMQMQAMQAAQQQNQQ